MPSETALSLIGARQVAPQTAHRGSLRRRTKSGHQGSVGWVFRLYSRLAALRRLLSQNSVEALWFRGRIGKVLGAAIASDFLQDLPVRRL
jgi:hypothetical protein